MRFVWVCDLRKCLSAMKGSMTWQAKTIHVMVDRKHREEMQEGSQDKM